MNTILTIICIAAVIIACVLLVVSICVCGFLDEYYKILNEMEDMK